MNVSGTQHCGVFVGGKQRSRTCCAGSGTEGVHEDMREAGFMKSWGSA